MSTFTKLGPMLITWRRLPPKYRWWLRRMGLAGPPLETRLDERADLRQFSIGRYSSGHLTVSDCTPGQTLRVGQFCSFAQGTHVLLGGEHRSDTVTTFRFGSRPPFQARYSHLAEGNAVDLGDVVIGNDVWIGANSTILSGVTIGDGAIIGAGSVVRRDVPPYAVVAGNPARVARFRVPEDQIEALLRIAWWDWPLEQIEEAVPLLLSNDLAEFIGQYDIPSEAPAES